MSKRGLKKKKIPLEQAWLVGEPCFAHITTKSGFCITAQLSTMQRKEEYLRLRILKWVYGLEFIPQQDDMHDVPENKKSNRTKSEEKSRRKIPEFFKR